MAPKGTWMMVDPKWPGLWPSAEVEPTIPAFLMEDYLHEADAKYAPMTDVKFHRPSGLGSNAWVYNHRPWLATGPADLPEKDISSAAENSTRLCRGIVLRCRSLRFPSKTGNLSTSTSKTQTP